MNQQPRTYRPALPRGPLRVASPLELLPLAQHFRRTSVLELAVEPHDRGTCWWILPHCPAEPRCPYGQVYVVIADPYRAGDRGSNRSKLPSAPSHRYAHSRVTKKQTPANTGPTSALRPSAHSSTGARLPTTLPRPPGNRKGKKKTPSLKTRGSPTPVSLRGSCSPGQTHQPPGLTGHPNSHARFHILPDYGRGPSGSYSGCRCFM